MHTPQEVQIVVTPADQSGYHASVSNSRRNTGDKKELAEFLISSRRQSLAVQRASPNSHQLVAQRRYMLE